GDILREIKTLHPGLDASRSAHELVRRVITRMIEDVLAETTRRLDVLGARSVDDIRGAAASVVAFSPVMAQADRAIKAFLLPRMYRHERVMSIMRAAEEVVAELFARYLEAPRELPEEWRLGLDPADPGAGARHIA